MQTTDTLLGSGEILLVLQSLLFAGKIVFLQLILCTCLLMFFLSNHEGYADLERLVVILSVLFLIPPALRARAFEQFWAFLSLTSSDTLFILWSLTYNSVFFFGAALAFLKSEGQRSAVDAVHELTRGIYRFWVFVRLLGPTIFGSGVAAFIITLMSGRELRILTKDRYPLSTPLSELWGGRDNQAAVLCLALTAFLVMLMAVALHVIYPKPTENPTRD